jgi:hypothetical protein
MNSGFLLTACNQHFGMGCFCNFGQSLDGFGISFSVKDLGFVSSNAVD